MHLNFLFPFSALQLCQISVQPPLNGELILRFQQLQSRLATLKIENEEVHTHTHTKKNTLKKVAAKQFSLRPVPTPASAVWEGLIDVSKISLAVRDAPVLASH